MKWLLVRNFSLNWQFRLFWPKLPKQGAFSLKEIKWISPLNSAYNNFLHQIYPKRLFPVKNGESEQQQHWIQHIQISVSIKFQLKLASLIFWTKFSQKEYFQSKMEKESITMEFWIFELVLMTSYCILFEEASVGGVLQEKVFLEFSQNSQENSCARVSVFLCQKHWHSYFLWILWNF